MNGQVAGENIETKLPAQAICKVAERAQDEEDLRIGMEEALGPMLERLEALEKREERRALCNTV